MSRKWDSECLTVGVTGKTLGDGERTVSSRFPDSLSTAGLDWVG